MKKFIMKTVHTLLKNIFYTMGGLFALSICIPAITLGQWAWFTDAESAFPYDINGQTYVDTEPKTTDIASWIIKSDTQNQTSILQRLTSFFRLSGTSYNPGGTNTSTATNYVKWILNILLGLVSFLSLAMIIFAFYLIFFSKGEDGVTKARKILVGVAIALAIMWLSWFIAQFFFSIYSTVTT